jgi:hypothetical protein
MVCELMLVRREGNWSFDWKVTSCLDLPVVFSVGLRILHVISSQWRHCREVV